MRVQMRCTRVGGGLGAIAGAVLSACAGPTDGAGEPKSDPPPMLATAEANFGAPPPTLGSFPSSLPGVANWEVHGTTDSYDVVIEGKSDAERQVVIMSFAYGGPTSQEAAFAFAADPSLRTDSDRIRAAIVHDWQTVAPSSAPSSSLVTPKGLLDGVGGELVTKVVKLTCPMGRLLYIGGGSLLCAGAACILAGGSGGIAIPADIACGVCAAGVVGSIVASNYDYCPLDPRLRHPAEK
jgi:hypothetical protein